MKISTRLRLCLSSLILIALICVNQTTVQATDVQIKIEPSAVVNLMYAVEVYGDSDSALPKDLTFQLVDDHGNVVAIQQIDDNQLIFADVPFGNYVIVPDSDSFWGTMKVQANQNYLETQHIFKRYYLFTNEKTAKNQIDNGDGTTSFIEQDNDEEMQVDTGVMSGRNRYLFLTAASVAALFFIIKINKKEEMGESENEN